MKLLIKISSTVFAGIFVVIALSYVSMEDISDNNGFNRVLERGIIQFEKSISKEEGVGNMISVVHDSLFFNGKAPNEIFRLSISWNQFHKMRLPLPDSLKGVTAYFHIIDTLGISVMASNKPAILEIKGSGENKEITASLSIFTRGVRMYNGDYVIRGFNRSLKTYDQIFHKIDARKGAVVAEPGEIIPKKGDAGISTDGLLHYDPKRKLIVYVFAYENKFVAIDTGLHIKYVGHTIDTTSRSKIEVSKVNSLNTITNTNPTKVVNGRSIACDGLLYISSKLKADNESIQDYKENTVIDIYDLKSGNYLKSFYIPNYRNQKVLDFRVYNHYIFALYSSYVVKYQLRKEIL